MAHIIEDTKCKRCGKNFIPAPYHIYQDDNGFYCGWSCFLHRNEKGPDRRCKQVHQYTLDGEFMKTYPSAKDAAACMGTVDPRDIRACCLGLTKTSAGFAWSYTKKETAPSPTKA
jgi:hypothetical protein